MRAVFNGQVIAESDDTVIVEGNHYFPPASLQMAFFSEPTGHTTHCPWKGQSEYRDITVDGQTASNAAWFYADPKDKAADIKDHVAFYGVVDVS